MSEEVNNNSEPLGLKLHDGGGSFSVYSESAETIALHILDGDDTGNVLHQIDLARGEGGIWNVTDERLQRGIKYVLRATGPEGPRHAFDSERNLLDPYAKGLVRENPRDYHCVALDTGFDWQGVEKPQTSMAKTIIYEAHVRGLTRINPAIPEEIRGSYAALGHPATIQYLQDLGITAIELLPIQAIISEPRLINLGLINYWGYNTINFFTPHMRYASEETRALGPEAMLAELKTAIRELHRAGIEVIMDVVYNHTAEGGYKGLTYSYRGLDNSSYYRQDDDGNYHDTTGCGNSLNFGNPMVQKLTLDSLRYWTSELQIDGYRFDLAATLARDESNQFRADHPLFAAMKQDPIISSAKLIVEPWDVGMGGWQTGNFPPGFPEWNDRYRDAVRKFWLTDIASARNSGNHHNGVQELAGRISGSQDIVSEGSPLGTVNFITAHDGFTLNDLVSYNVKHNSANGEGNRDGSNNNHSYNHSHEGESKNEEIFTARQKAARNLMGTLLLSAGVPMITAGDERLKTQGGNNNAYCQDNIITWQHFDEDEAKDAFFETTRYLIELRKAHPVLRPERFTHMEPADSENDQMLWFKGTGKPMSVEEDWHNPERRSMQRLSFHQNHDGTLDGMLLIVNGREADKLVTLPASDGVKGYELLWDSSLALPPEDRVRHSTGSEISVGPTSILLFKVITV
jgi:glycogen debranching enzyme